MGHAAVEHEPLAEPSILIVEEPVEGSKLDIENMVPTDLVNRNDIVLIQDRSGNLRCVKHRWADRRRTTVTRFKPPMKSPEPRSWTTQDPVPTPAHKEPLVLRGASDT